MKDSLIEKLDYAKLPDFNRDDWNDRFMDQAFDPGNAVSIPKNWGTTGIAFRSSKVSLDVTSWKQFFEVAGTTYEGARPSSSTTRSARSAPRPLPWATR